MQLLGTTLVSVVSGTRSATVVSEGLSLHYIYVYIVPTKLPFYPHVAVNSIESRVNRAVVLSVFICGSI